MSVNSSEPVDLYLTVTAPDDRARGARMGAHAGLHGLRGDGCLGRRPRWRSVPRSTASRWRRPAVAPASGACGSASGPRTQGRLVAGHRGRAAHGAGSVIGTGISPELHLVDEVPAVIITSRHHLYEGSYDFGQAVTLLGTVTQAAQGPTRGPAGSLRAAIYYVDDYSDLARDWCNESWDPSSEDTANVVTRAIDELLDDWLEDSDGNEEIVILGDDDIIPVLPSQVPLRGRGK